MEGYDGLSEYQEVLALLDEVDGHIEKMRAAGCQVGKNERDYRVAVATETLKLRAAGETATSARDIVRGMKYVSDLKCALTCAESNRDAEKEAINSKKKRATIIHEQMMRDLSNTRGMQ